MLIETYFSLITDLGNAVVVGAMAAVVALYLLAAGSRRSALALLLVFITAACGIGIAKMLCLSCHATPVIPSLRSPSGHAAMSSSVYSMMTAIIVSGMQRWQRVMAWLCNLGVIVLVAASRFLLGFHTISEVAVGLLVGLTSYLIISRVVLKQEPVHFNGRAVALTAFVVFLVLHGVSVPMEHFLQWVASQIRPHISVC